MADEFPGDIQPRVFDQYVDTSITVSCYRETHRLDRMLKLFHKCMTIIADQNGQDALVNFRGAIRKLHDSKGNLIVTWRHNADFANYRSVVEAAWQDCGEASVFHEDRYGHEIRLRLGDAPVDGFRTADHAMRILRSEKAKEEDNPWIPIGDAAGAVIDKFSKNLKG